MLMYKWITAFLMVLSLYTQHPGIRVCAYCDTGYIPYIHDNGFVGRLEIPISHTDSWTARISIHNRNSFIVSRNSGS